MSRVTSNKQALLVAVEGVIFCFDGRRALDEKPSEPSVEPPFAARALQRSSRGVCLEARLLNGSTSGRIPSRNPTTAIACCIEQRSSDSG